VGRREINAHVGDFAHLLNETMYAQSAPLCKFLYANFCSFSQTFVRGMVLTYSKLLSSHINQGSILQDVGVLEVMEIIVCGKQIKGNEVGVEGKEGIWLSHSRGQPLALTLRPLEPNQ
jgi:hypothetical protein